MLRIPQAEEADRRRRQRLEPTKGYRFRGWVTCNRLRRPIRKTGDSQIGRYLGGHAALGTSLVWTSAGHQHRAKLAASKPLEVTLTPASALGRRSINVIDSIPFR